MIKMKDRTPCPFGTYYEFGTGWGGTLAAFMLAAEQVASGHGLSAEDFRVFAFDTFELGIPLVVIGAALFTFGYTREHRSDTKERNLTVPRPKRPD